MQIVRRAAHWRCPNCGRGRLFRGVFRMLPRCPECGLSYFPEQGYYVGAMIINYVATTAVVVAIFLLSLLLVRHSYSFWLGIDFWITPRQPDASSKEKS
jgi:uncharacterized protein (DUF983 family)